MAITGVNWANIYPDAVLVAGRWNLEGVFGGADGFTSLVTAVLKAIVMMLIFYWFTFLPSFCAMPTLVSRG